MVPEDVESRKYSISGKSIHAADLKDRKPQTEEAESMAITTFALTYQKELFFLNALIFWLRQNKRSENWK